MKIEDENLNLILEDLKDEIEKQPPITDLFEAYEELLSVFEELSESWSKEGSAPYAIATWKLAVETIRILTYIRSTVDED